MGRRSLLAVLLIPLGCLSLGLILFFLTTDRSSQTLADLAPRDSQNPASGWRFLPSTQLLGEISAADWILIVYLFVGSIVALIALRFIISSVRMAHADRKTSTLGDSLGKNSGSFRDVTEDLVSPAHPSRLVVPTETAEEFDLPETLEIDHRRPKEPFFVEVRDHFRSYARGLTGKIIMTFTAIVAAFGLLTAALVYWTLSAALWSHAIQRANIIAVNVSDSAPAYILARNSNGPRELLRRLSTKSEIAYLLILDRSGKIFADSFPVRPDEMEKLASANLPIDQSGRRFRLGNGIVYEVAVPILEGRLGTVRVGLWEDDVEKSIRETLTPVIAWIALIMFGGIVAAFFLAWRINRPIVRLVRAARDISHGELDSPGSNIADTGEYGEISRALERMRSSVRAAMIRLNGEYY